MVNITYCDVDGTFLFSSLKTDIVLQRKQVGRDFILDSTTDSYFWAKSIINHLNGIDYKFYISESSIYLGKKLSEVSDIVLNTAARYSTLISREHLMPFVSSAIIENGGLLFLKKEGVWQRDEGWWEELSGERKVLWEFHDYLARKYGVISDTEGRTTMLRYRQKDNESLDLRDLIGGIKIPEELQITYNLGHFDFIPKKSGKHNAKDYLESKYGSVSDAAIGDDWNDVVLLSNVKYPILMGNAPDAIKEIARVGNWNIVGNNMVGINQALSLLIGYFS